MTLYDFLFENWGTLISTLGSVLGMAGWIVERGKRMRDNRASDVAFWEQTIEKQNAYIERQDARIELIEKKYERRIQDLETQNQRQREEMTKMQGEMEDMSTRLEKYEPRNQRKAKSNHEA